MEFSHHSVLFRRFADTILSFTPETAHRAFEELALATSGPLEVLYAPFDHMPERADIVIVGITPGKTQTIKALGSAAQALRRGASDMQAMQIAKLVASFSGAMRSNLIAMLDHIGVNSRLSIKSCATIFEPSSERIHFTSALRYPVFVNRYNYNGAPDMLATPLLRSMIDQLLTEEAARMPDAIWLPLGPQAGRALGHLVWKGVLRKSQILHGLPHPSGANAERIAYFLGRKEKGSLSTKTNPSVLDAALVRLRANVSELTP